MGKEIRLAMFMRIYASLHFQLLFGYDDKFRTLHVRAVIVTIIKANIYMFRRYLENDWCIILHRIKSNSCFLVGCCAVYCVVLSHSWHDHIQMGFFSLSILSCIHNDDTIQIERVRASTSVCACALFYSKWTRTFEHNTQFLG